VVLLRDGIGPAGTLELLAGRWGGWGERMGGRAGGARGELALAFAVLTRFRWLAVMSTDAGRGAPPSTLICGSVRGISALLVVLQCCASIDRLSSIGVKMLCAFACAGNGLGCGIGGLVN